MVIDQKFHTGMKEYVRRLWRPLACILPRMFPSEAAGTMGMEFVPYSDMPYQVHVISAQSPGPEDGPILERVLDDTALAYIRDSTRLDYLIARMCRERSIPYVVTSEYTLRTVLDIMRAGTRSALRRGVRELGARIDNRSRLQLVVHAAEVHANGYPTYAELAKTNPRRVLFFDTRAVSADLVSREAIVRRVESLDNRPPRLLFSGRYHRMKGALDVVKTGIELLRRGVKFRLDTYGSGPQGGEMRALVRQEGAEGSISVHDPIPYRPDLIEVTRAADLFMVCHIQGDPSCTYLETFACGVPIAGYANEMWSELQRQSQAGLVASIGDHKGLASAIESLLQDRERLLDVSLHAREFAAGNTMDLAWDRRTRRLEALADGPKTHGPGT